MSSRISSRESGLPHLALEEVCGLSSLFSAIKSVAVKDFLTNEDVPVGILDSQVRRLRNNEVALVKVLWGSQFV